MHSEHADDARRHELMLNRLDYALQDLESIRGAKTIEQNLESAADPTPDDLYGVQPDAPEITKESSARERRGKICAGTPNHPTVFHPRPY